MNEMANKVAPQEANTALENNCAALEETNGKLNGLVGQLHAALDRIAGSQPSDSGIGGKEPETPRSLLARQQDAIEEYQLQVRRLGDALNRLREI